MFDHLQVWHCNDSLALTGIIDLSLQRDIVSKKQRDRSETQQQQQAPVRPTADGFAHPSAFIKEVKCGLIMPNIHNKALSGEIHSVHRPEAAHA